MALKPLHFRKCDAWRCSCECVRAVASDIYWLPINISFAVYTSIQVPVQHEQEHQLLVQYTPTWHGLCRKWDMEEHASLCDCSCVQFRPEMGYCHLHTFFSILIKWLLIPEDSVDTRTVCSRLKSKLIRFLHMKFYVEMGMKTLACPSKWHCALVLQPRTVNLFEHRSTVGCWGIQRAAWCGNNYLLKASHLDC